MWDDDMDNVQPAAINSNSSKSGGGGGFCVGRGRGFGQMSTLSDALPKLGSDNYGSKSISNNSGWNDSGDSGWDDNAESQNSNTYSSNSWQSSKTDNNWSGGNSNYKSNDRVCFTCNRPGHMSRDCTTTTTTYTNFSRKPRGKGCFKCGEEGHMSRDCPSGDSRGGGGNRSRACFKCNQEGHMSRDCPNEDSRGSRGGGGGSRACHKCGEEGHMARDCTNEDSRGGGRGGGGGSRACHKCGEEGHMARDCTNEDSRGGSRGGGGGRGCHKCGEEGHMARDCTSSGGGGDSRGCHNCGETGHMARECPSEKKSKGCFKCGEEGHMSKDCEAKVGQDGKAIVPLYIPPDPSDDAEIVFASVPAGINFSKYEAIPVDVTGSDPHDFITSFESSGLNRHLLGNIKRSGYDVPTPIQKYAIPVIMKHKDLMGCAQTGSGKTAAFLLPMIHDMLADSNLPNNNGKEPQEPVALILAPTRELAMQIMSEARKFSHDSVVKAEVAYGGASTSHQVSRLMKGVHILVATPGRLNDLIEKGKVSLGCLKYFVLDEADRMLDMGFMPAVQKMVDTMPPKGERQTLMFSATFAEEIQRVSADFLNQNYAFITVGTVGGANSDVEQVFFQLGQYEKREKLMEILKESGTDRVLVFAEQKRTADFLASFTSQNNIPTTSIHGDRLQREREEALRDFRTGRMPVLVATAVAARGLDIKDVRHVINYDLPSSREEYVHRIGRTGRVGNLGKATSFYDSDVDRPLARELKKILIDAQQVIPDWMHEEAEHDVGSTYGSSRGGFGGRDVRNQGRPKKSNDAWDGDFSQSKSESTPSYSQPVAADEFWD